MAAVSKSGIDGIPCGGDIQGVSGRDSDAADDRIICLDDGCRCYSTHLGFRPRFGEDSHQGFLQLLSIAHSTI
jgi:hypothetical protein